MFLEIKGAINAEADGNEIIVSPGTYYENINISGKKYHSALHQPTNLTIVASPIINGQFSDSVVMCAGTKLESCVLAVFTIKEGSAPYGWYLRAGTMATIQNNTIIHNSANYEGELYSWGGIIQNNTILENQANYGGLRGCGVPSRTIPSGITHLQTLGVDFTHVLALSGIGLSGQMLRQERRYFFIHLYRTYSCIQD